MSKRRPKADDFLRIGPKIRALPIIHGSGDYAIRVREEMLSRPYDCLAVPLPPSFQDDVEAAVENLPAISVVVQLEEGEQVARRDAEVGRDRLADRAELLDEAGERVQDVPVQRRRVRLPLAWFPYVHAHDLVNN